MARGYTADGSGRAGDAPPAAARGILPRMPGPPLRPIATVVLASALVASCSSTSRFAGTPGTAVIVCESGREADAEAARAALAEVRWIATIAPAGPAARTRSSVAIYGQRHRPGRGADLADVLRPALGDIEVLPFLAEGPGRHDAVIWLAR